MSLTSDEMKSRCTFWWGNKCNDPCAVIEENEEIICCVDCDDFKTNKCKGCIELTFINKGE